MRTYEYLWTHLPELFLPCKMSQTKVTEKNKTHFMSFNLIPKIARLCVNWGKYCTAGQTTMLRMRTTFWTFKVTDTDSLCVILIARAGNDSYANAPIMLCLYIGSLLCSLCTWNMTSISTRGNTVIYWLHCTAIRAGQTERSCDRLLPILRKVFYGFPLWLTAKAGMGS
jgi:hypothetical protein